MKELVKNDDRFEIVEDGKTLFSTTSGPQVLEHLEKAKYPVLYIHCVEPWVKDVSEP